MKFVLASHNAGKLTEFRQIFKGHAVELVSQVDLGVEEPEETGATFIENAILKARHACEQTGLPSLADDSGLAVDALQGAPGIYSARYASNDRDFQKNVDKLLYEMQDVVDEQRTARFHCVLALMQHASDPTPVICHGIWEGSILTAPIGSAGFGYDPVFYVSSHQCSAAELDPTVKNTMSHRGRAIQQLVKKLCMP